MLDKCNYGAGIILDPDRLVIYHAVNDLTVYDHVLLLIEYLVHRPFVLHKVHPLPADYTEEFRNVVNFREDLNLI